MQVDEELGSKLSEMFDKNKLFWKEVKRERERGGSGVICKRLR